MWNFSGGAAVVVLAGCVASCERVPALDPIPTTGTHFLVGRYGAAGAPDTTFGHDGFVAIDFGGTSRANAIAVDAQRRYFVAGEAESGGYRQFAVASLHEHGNRNARVDGDGRLIVGFSGPQGWARDLAMDRHGGALLTWPYVVGRTEGADGIRVAIARIGEFGPEADFGIGGLVEGTFPGLTNPQAYAVAVDAESRVVVVCDSDGDRGFFLVRYLADGRLDGTFASRGVGRVPWPGITQAAGLNLTIDARGRHLVSGWASPTGSFAHATVARYDASGALDRTFGTAGVAMVVPEGFLDESLVAIMESEVAGLTLLDDGRIRMIVAVAFRDDRGLLVSRSFLAGLNADGRPDPSFDASGFIPLTVPGVPSPHLTAITTSGERVVIVGSGETEVPPPAARRTQGILLGFRPDGRRDLAFGSSGVARRDFPLGRSGQLLDVIVDTVGRLVVAGLVQFD
ncbi:MAG TPA: hypothetical protein PKW63_14060 [Vicinamibacterales bacterium]|jgi:uncharacterized delta-60 repeat protein|nr:hypothetical protein [Vicinamibacterales bacterium]